MIIDPDDPVFFNPPFMPDAIDGFCRKTGQMIPDGAGQHVNTILRSLALAHRYVLEQLVEVSPRPVNRIHIIGGGAQNDLLCRYTADATGLPVYAGPIEATATGNILMQAVAKGQISSPETIRKTVRLSFPIRVYDPENGSRWDDLYHRFKAMKHTV
jgi:rhamnulokinase